MARTMPKEKKKPSTRARKSLPRKAKISGTKKATKLEVINKFLEEIGDNAKIEDIISSNKSEGEKNTELTNLFKKWRLQHFSFLQKANLDSRDKREKICNVRMELHEKEKNFRWIECKESGLVKGETGLYANRQFKVGEIITVYAGKMNSNECQSKHKFLDLIADPKEDVYFLAQFGNNVSISPTYLISKYAKEKKKKKKNVVNNAEIGKNFLVTATRSIYNGDEIFVDYNFDAKELQNERAAIIKQHLTFDVLKEIDDVEDLKDLCSILDIKHDHCKRNRLVGLKDLIAKMYMIRVDELREEFKDVEKVRDDYLPDDLQPGKQRQEQKYNRIVYCCNGHQTILEVAKVVAEKYGDGEIIDEETIQKYARRIAFENFYRFSEPLQVDKYMEEKTLLVLPLKF